MKHLRSLLMASAFMAVFGTAASAAEREGVVVSIKPLHSLVAAVMQGVGEPKLIVQGAGSEHSYSLKPSDAEAIEHAKVIFWAGPSMETFLDKPFDTLGEGAKVVALGEADGLTKLKFREGGPFEAHDHGGEESEHAHNNEHEGHKHEAHDHAHKRSMTTIITPMKHQKKPMSTTIMASLIFTSGLIHRTARFSSVISPRL